MTDAVGETCIKCKLMDCIEACSLDCFYEGENLVVIHPDECIDCGECAPECPVQAVKPDSDPGREKWLAKCGIRKKMAEHQPRKRHLLTLRNGKASPTNSSYISPRAQVQALES